MYNRPKLGEILIRRGVITPGQLLDALERQKTTKMLLGHILVTRGHCTPQQVTEALLDQASSLLDEQNNVLRTSVVDIEGWRRYVSSRRAAQAVASRVAN